MSMKKMFIISFVLLSITLVTVKSVSNAAFSEQVAIIKQSPNKFSHKKKSYTEKKYPTPNIDKERKNTVQGVILHHTAEPTIEKSLAVLTSKTKKVGTHVVIDTDGTRYIMASPETVTFHAGLSVLDGKEGCNSFTIGIEFQGNTLEAPLTDDQIQSAIEYLQPLVIKYMIPIRNIVTHEMVRQAYKRKYPRKRCSGKVDITQQEYKRFMKAFQQALNVKTINN